MAKIIINCSRVEFIPTPHIESISGTDITLKSGKSINILKTNQCEISEQSKHVNAGDLINQSLSLLYRESTQVLNKLLRLPLVLRIYRNDDTILLFGSLDHPALLSTASVNVNSGSLKFVKQATSFEYILAKATQFD